MSIEATAPAPAQAEAFEATPAPAPAAVAGAAVQVNEAPVYTFNGSGPSFVRDVYAARFGLDRDAQDRLARFNSAMLDGGNQVATVTAAVDTRTTAPTLLQNPTYKPELLQAIDKGRPLVSRIGTVNLTDATPFRLPVEGEFSGVGDHVEGTAHVAEGDLTLSDVIVTPGAVSGAFRISRELVDASNPAIDLLALRAMLRDYRKVTEAKVVAALAAAAPTPVLGVDRVMELRVELNKFADIDDLPADFVAASTNYYAALLADADSTQRPMLPSLGAVNAVGEAKAGYTGAHVDGVEIAKASAVTGNIAYLLRAESVFIGESPVQTFRFDEVEGPGVIKLALFSYFAAKVLRPSGVVAVSAA